MSETNGMLNVWLTVDQINVVLGALGKLPYDVAAPLINHIHTQANEQLHQSESPATEHP